MMRPHFDAMVRWCRSVAVRSWPTVRVGLETIVNPTWRAYLESMGYTSELIQYGSTWTNTLTKVFTL